MTHRGPCQHLLCCDSVLVGCWGRFAAAGPCFHTEEPVQKNEDSFPLPLPSSRRADMTSVMIKAELRPHASLPCRLLCKSPTSYRRFPTPRGVSGAGEGWGRAG